MRRRDNSFGGSGPAIDLRFRFSPVIALTCLVIHGLAFIMLVMLLHPALAVAGSALLGISAARAMGMPGLGRSATAIAHASWHDDQTWTLIERGGRAFEATLTGGVSLGHSLVFLRWRCPGGHGVFAVTGAGGLDPVTLRRLQARLRLWRGS